MNNRRETVGALHMNFLISYLEAHPTPFHQTATPVKPTSSTAEPITEKSP